MSTTDDTPPQHELSEGPAPLPHPDTSPAQSLPNALPLSPSSPRRGCMLGLFLLAPLLTATLLAAYIFLLPAPTNGMTNVVVPRGTGLRDTSLLLVEQGVLYEPHLFDAASRLFLHKGLKAGEYSFAPHARWIDVFTTFKEGKTFIRRLTVPEGLSSQQIVELIARDSTLAGDTGAVPPEGSLMPDTYYYSFGDSRAEIMARMRTAMQTNLEKMWPDRDTNLPVATPAEALVIASLVEKETAVPAERPVIAGVFYNRLRTGMRLQSDPTVVYALSKGKGDLGRGLTRADLTVDSPFNTYVSAALPPTPIANPGRASIEAALHPARHDFYYFVADGSGGHAFAQSLEDHQKNVASWYKIRQSRTPGEGAQPVSAPPTGP